MPVLRRRLQRRHLADAGHRHLERARDRRRTHGQDVDVGLELLEGVLVLDAEALLLVDDEQAEVFEEHLLGEDPVRADDHVDGAVGDPGERVARLLVGLEARQRLHLHGEAGEALRERLDVLLDQQRRGNEHRDLLAVLDRLERGTDGHLGLAESDVAGQQPVHRDRLLHVGLDLVDRLELIERLGERERLFELALPRRVRPEGVPLRRHARGVELHELDRDVAHRSAGFALRLRPVAAAHLGQHRGLSPDVLRQQVELVGGDEELVAGVAALGRRVLEHEVLADALDRVAAAAGDLALGELDEPADAVGRVHDVVAGLQLQRIDHVAAARGQLLDDPAVAADRASVELRLGEHGELRLERPRSRVRSARRRGARRRARAPRAGCPPGGRRSRARRARRARARRGRLRRSR